MGGINPEIPVFVNVHGCVCVYLSYIFSVCADVVCCLRVVSTFGQPFADGCTVCGRVVHLTAFKTETAEGEKNK